MLTEKVTAKTKISYINDPNSAGVKRTKFIHQTFFIYLRINKAVGF